MRALFYAGKSPASAGNTNYRVKRNQRACVLCASQQQKFPGREGKVEDFYP